MTDATNEPCPLDREHLNDMSGGDIEFETELMEEFLKVTPELLSEISGALDAGEMETVEQVAHSLKGSCRSLGARPMSEPCEMLEHGARAGDLAQGPHLLREIHAQYDVLRDYIHQTWNVRAA